MIPLDLTLLVGVGIYKCSFTCHSTVLLELVEGHFKRKGWATSLEKDGTRKKVLREVPNNLMFKARLRQLLSDICITKVRTLSDILYQQHEHQKLVFWFCFGSDTDLRRNNSKVAQEQQKLLKRINGREGLECHTRKYLEWISFAIQGT